MHYGSHQIAHIICDSSKLNESSKLTHVDIGEICQTNQIEYKREQNNPNSIKLYEVDFNFLS